MSHRQLAATLVVALGVGGAACGSTSSPPPAAPSAGSFLGRLETVSQVAPTVPANGDVNPYGVAVVPASVGRLTAGDVLVSNFNSKSNVQGTGTTLVEVSPTGATQLFAQLSELPSGLNCPGGIGLTAALGILSGGWVVVGSLPTTVQGALPSLNPVGCLIVLDSEGVPVETITNRDIVGPWDLTVTSNPTSAEIFVSNALGGNTSTDQGVPSAGNCTVVRLDLVLNASSAPVLASTTIVGRNYPWRANKAALVLAPTGLVLARDGTLYVDDTQTDTISAIPHAVSRTDALDAAATTITSGGALNAPLGMTLAPNGDLVVVNGNDGDAVEISPAGTQLAAKRFVKNGAGDLFGLTTTADGDGILFANDGTNALDLIRI